MPQNITIPRKRRGDVFTIVYKSKQKFIAVFYASGGISREDDRLSFICMSMAM
jgi:hypothetical protein